MITSCPAGARQLVIRYLSLPTFRITRENKGFGGRLDISASGWHRTVFLVRCSCSAPLSTAAPRRGPRGVCATVALTLYIGRSSPGGVRRCPGGYQRIRTLSMQWTRLQEHGQHGNVPETSQAVIAMGRNTWKFRAGSVKLFFLPLRIGNRRDLARVRPSTRSPRNATETGSRVPDEQRTSHGKHHRSYKTTTGMKVEPSPRLYTYRTTDRLLPRFVATMENEIHCCVTRSATGSVPAPRRSSPAAFRRPWPGAPSLLLLLRRSSPPLPRSSRPNSAR